MLKMLLQLLGLTSFILINRLLNRTKNKWLGWNCSLKIQYSAVSAWRVSNDITPISFAAGSTEILHKQQLPPKINIELKFTIYIITFLIQTDSWQQKNTKWPKVKIFSLLSFSLIKNVSDQICNISKVLKSI